MELYIIPNSILAVESLTEEFIEEEVLHKKFKFGDEVMGVVKEVRKCLFIIFNVSFN